MKNLGLTMQLNKNADTQLTPTDRARKAAVRSSERLRVAAGEPGVGGAVKP